MSGMTENTFAPSATATRAQLATILHRLSGSLVVTTQNTFIDVVADSWYAGAINWAISTGVFNGFEDNTFRPAQDITREQLAVVIYNYAVYQGFGSLATGNLKAFNDESEVSAWAYNAMQWAVGNGIIGGKNDNILDPKGSATRAEIAAIITRFLNYIK